MSSLVIHRTLLLQGDCLKALPIHVEIHCNIIDGKVVIEYALTPEEPEREELINRDQLECRLNTEYQLNGHLRQAGLV